MLTRRSVLALPAVLGGMAKASASKQLLVAAASDLQLVLPKLSAAFERAGGPVLSFSIGATGNLARQIRQGAPFEVFLAADESFIEALAADAVIPDRGVAYARGRLALVAGKTTPFAKDVSLAGLAMATQARQPVRIAIANPEHAPYGRRAVEALDSQGVLDILRPRLVYGETVAQALQLVATGAAAAGLVGSSLVREGPAAAAVVAVTLPEAWHSPITQRLAVTRRGGDDARRFASFMTGTDAQAILTRFGFDLPQ